MCRRACVFLILAVCFASVACYRSKSEEECITYYKNGKFDLSELSGSFYAVYFWPPKQRQRDDCQVINFRRLGAGEINRAQNECGYLSDISKETVVSATYTNSTGKTVNLLYYGDNEVKSLYRSCGLDIHMYIFTKLDDNYVLGIDCSSGGFGVLMSRTFPSLNQAYNEVNNIEIMTGRDGSPDCQLG